MRRIVLAGTLAPGQLVKFSEAEAHYLYQVLRLGPGAEIIGLDSAGRAFAIVLAANGHGRVSGEAAETAGEPALAVSLYLPLLKGGKLDLVVQKSVELGVKNIYLYAAERAVIRGGNLAKKLGRLQAIAREATRQSRRQLVPAIQGTMTLAEAAQAGPGIFAWELETKQGLHSLLAASKDELHLLTGPEGGLTRGEAGSLTAAGWQAVTLGPRVLRAETAAIALVTCVMFARGEMG